MDWLNTDSISSTAGPGQKSDSGGYYDFGPLGRGANFAATVTLDPKDAGNHACDVDAADLRFAQKCLSWLRCYGAGKCGRTRVRRLP